MNLIYIYNIFYNFSFKINNISVPDSKAKHHTFFKQYRLTSSLKLIK